MLHKYAKNILSTIKIAKGNKFIGCTMNQMHDSRKNGTSDKKTGKYYFMF